jgi:site-specific DNA recombinase
VRSIAASEVEGLVLRQMRRLVGRRPSWSRGPSPRCSGRAVTAEDLLVDENKVIEALGTLEPVWDEPYPVEQARILQLLVARVVVRVDGLEIILRVEGITSLIEDLRLRESTERRAA